MFDRYYLRRLENDLDAWAENGWVTQDGAARIRRHVEAGAGRTRLPGVLGALGALLIAASFFAFIAANWDGVPRIGRVGLVYLLLGATLAGAWGMARAQMRNGADSATTLATLVFAGGVALIGQMYHLPADWPGGALLVGIGALVAAFLGRSRGALVVACAAIGIWTFGRITGTDGATHLAFWPVFALAAWLGASRPGMLSRHAVVLLLGGHLGTWLVTFPLGSGGEWSRAAIAMGLASGFAAAGFALARLSPAFGRTLAHWSIWVFATLLCLFNFVAGESRSLERDGLAGIAVLALMAGAILPVAVIVVAEDRRAAALLAAAMLPGLAIIPAVLALPAAAELVVPVLALAGSVALVGAGLFAASRPIAAAGYTAFGAIVLWLMHRTIGSLLDQSLFFLAAGIVLLAFGWGARRLIGATAAPARAP
ncbi:membrane protein [Allostella vacuolata]|nr:membrane protein [Stella vacuolata]